MAADSPSPVSHVKHIINQLGFCPFLTLRPSQNCMGMFISEKWSYWGCTSSPDSNSPANKRWVMWNALTCLGDKNSLAWVFIPSVRLRFSSSFNRNPKSIVVYDPTLLSTICEAYRRCFVGLGDSNIVPPHFASHTSSLCWFSETFCSSVNFYDPEIIELFSVVSF